MSWCRASPSDGKVNLSFNPCIATENLRVFCAVTLSYTIGRVVNILGTVHFIVSFTCSMPLILWDYFALHSAQPKP